ncbi:MAG: hypothetical protein JRI33_03800 [Deltaproteobacteria bacterium]|nr:hypothetical protein [Deltaproteobacteria bacterium]
MAETIIAIIHLKSFGFLHPGRERFKRVTKEAWLLIPGSTLYGAAAAALVRLDCRRGEANLNNCTECQKNPRNDCGYLALLREVKGGRLRFSPLVVTSSKGNQTFYTAEDYSRDAALVLTRLGICPRAPLGRQTASIFKEKLHGLVAHQPFQEYRGFVRTNPEFLNKHLKRALRALPFFPFGGGRGKFTQIEAKVLQEYENKADFCPPRPVTCLGLLTPAILPSTPPRLGTIAGTKNYDLENFRLRRYTFWRTGLYWDGEPHDFKKYGGAAVQDHLTQARLGLTEDAVFHLQYPKPEDIQTLFLNGLGAPEFTYLGWGQVYFKEF